MSVLFLTRPQPPEVFVAKMAALAPEIESFGAIEACDPAAVEAVVCYRLPRGIGAKLPNLRMICASSAGVDKILGVEGLPTGLPVVRIVDDAQNRQIAQYVAMSALNHLRERTLYARQQVERAWTRHPIPAPDAATVGVLGLGAAGQVTASMMLGLGLRVAGWSRSPRTLAGIETFHGPAGLDACLAKSDILVCLLPLTDDTRGLLDRRALARLPKGAYLVNVARGAHVVEPDLLGLIDEGHLAGAALDVQATEPLPADSPLWTHPAVVVTPHVASQPTVDSVTRQVIESVRRLREGRPLENVVDPARGY
jgi:glyoxylate/hydroxypyruvate reductase A